MRVIGWLLAIEHAHFLVFPERHEVAIVDIADVTLLPHVPIAVFLAIACAQVDGEGIAAKE